MSQYFKKEQTQELLLSEYLLKEESEFKPCIFDEQTRQRRTKYILGILGDVPLDKETYKLFIKQFQSYGGRYDVRTKPETIKGIYEITRKYPSLTADAIDEIWFVYIKDQFEEYTLVEMLGKYIELHGQTDDAIHAYLDFIDRKAKEFDRRFISEAESLVSYKGEYGEDLIKHLQYIIKSQHITAEQITSSLPCKELIEKDRQQLIDIASRTRIYMGMCQPISYQMIESLAVGEGLDYYPEHPSYLINKERKVESTFTKQEFLDSIKKHTEDSKTKQLKKYKEVMNMSDDNNNNNAS